MYIGVSWYRHLRIYFHIYLYTYVCLYRIRYVSHTQQYTHTQCLTYTVSRMSYSYHSVQHQIWFTYTAIHTYAVSYKHSVSHHSVSHLLYTTCQKAQPIPLGVTFSKALSKLKAQSSKVSFHWHVAKETFELWALSFKTAFENVTLGGIGCTGRFMMYYIYIDALHDVHEV